MTVNDSANLPVDGGSKTVDPSATDNLDDLDYWEPEDDQANPENGDDGIADGTDEAADDADQEAGDLADDDDQPDDVDEDAGGKPTDDAAIDDTMVTLSGGEQVPVKELKLGYLRERDYRLKTQDVATEKRGLGEMAKRVEGTAQAIATFLASQLPEEPSPQLAMTNPGAYTQQKVIYDAAMQRVQQIINAGQVPQQVSQHLTETQQNELLAAEDAKLRETFPETAKPEGRKQFFERAFTTGRELGFSDEEMAAFTDHRHLKVIHYARLGLAAERAKKTAMDKVNNAPPAVARGKPQGGNVQQVRKNKDAMARLNKSGSLEDALKVDWE